MIFTFLIASSLIGVEAPAVQTVHLTREMLVGISDDLIKSDIAEVDIDPTVFDIPQQTKARKKDVLDEVQFITESENPCKPGEQVIQ